VTRPGKTPRIIIVDDIHQEPTSEQRVRCREYFLYTAGAPVIWSEANPDLWDTEQQETK
jgi:hypothetical protein